MPQLRSTPLPWWSGTARANVDHVIDAGPATVAGSVGMAEGVRRGDEACGATPDEIAILIYKSVRTVTFTSRSRPAARPLLGRLDVAPVPVASVPTQTERFPRRGRVAPGDRLLDAFELGQHGAPRHAAVIHPARVDEPSGHDMQIERLQLVAPCDRSQERSRRRNATGCNDDRLHADVFAFVRTSAQFGGDARRRRQFRSTADGSAACRGL